MTGNSATIRFDVKLVIVLSTVALPCNVLLMAKKGMKGIEYIHNVRRITSTF